MKLLYTLFGLYLSAIGLCCGQASPLFIPPPGSQLDSGWMWHAGDNLNWAKPDFADANWEPIQPGRDIMDIPQLWKTDVGWFRLRFTVDSLRVQKALALLVQQTGASEIYLNGQLIAQFGAFGSPTEPVRAATPATGTFIGAPIHRAGEQVLAVRFAIQKDVRYIEFVNLPNIALSLRLVETEAINFFRQHDVRPPFDYFKFGLFLLLAIIHLALFGFNTAQRANFYFFVYALGSAAYSLLLALVYYYVEDASAKTLILSTVSLLYLTSSVYVVTALYDIFDRRRGVIYWLLAGYAVVSVVLLFSHYHGSFGYGVGVIMLAAILESIRVTFLAARRKQRGASVIVGGAVVCLLFNVLWLLFLFRYLPGGPAWIYGHIASNVAFTSIPVSISIYLALEASFTSRTLTQKLTEVEQLSGEKQQILAMQNELLEQQVNERTAELKHSLYNLRTTQNQLIQREKLASLGELTAGIAHEIQNPLNFVNNFSEVSTELVKEIEEERVKGDERDEELEVEILGDLRLNLQKITHHGRRASAIVKGMLEHSRSSGGEKQFVNVNTLASEYLRLAYQGQLAKDKNFKADTLLSLAPDVSKVNVVPQDIGRVLLNLYNNAFYAVQQRRSEGPPTGVLATQEPSAYTPTVWVSTQQQMGQIEICVRDNGTGIPADILSKIFQPFFTTKPTGEGIGLGLSLSYDIVTKGHVGDLRVESEAGRFTQFVVRLPIGSAQS